MDKQTGVLENMLIHYYSIYHKYKTLWDFIYLITLLEVQGLNINRRKGYDETLTINCVPVRFLKSRVNQDT